MSYLIHRGLVCKSASLKYGQAGILDDDLNLDNNILKTISLLIAHVSSTTVLDYGAVASLKTQYHYIVQLNTVSDGTLNMSFSTAP